MENVMELLNYCNGECDDCELDCNGECGGNAVVDECGE